MFTITLTTKVGTIFYRGTKVHEKHSLYNGRPKSSSRRTKKSEKGIFTRLPYKGKNGVSSVEKDVNLTKGILAYVFTLKTQFLLPIKIPRTE